jgi:antibiotic biosynthesis monooxygenase (ABM) superfamily enzyme
MSVSDIVIEIVMDFVLGILAVWLYALIRPRCGAGAKTALFAGVGLWVLTGLLPTIMWGSLRLFSVRLLTINVLTYLVMVIVATLLGAWVYKEQAP